MQEIQQDIIEIQTKLAFQEETIEQLNDVIIRQQNAIDKLQIQLKQLDKKIDEESQQWQTDVSLNDEKPPHY
ncbi:MAG: SlyX family protein [Marinicellaceae bacterium]